MEERGKGLKERNRQVKRKRQKQIIRMNLILAAVVILLLIILLAKSCAGKKSQAELLEHTDTFYSGVYVDEMNLGGMTLEEAKDALLKKTEQDCAWDMQVVNGDKSYRIEDILSDNLDEVLGEAFRIGRTGEDEARKAEIEGLLENPVYLKLEDKYDAARLDTIIEEAGRELDTKMENADLTGYDAATGEFKYSDGRAGYELNQEALRQQIQEAIENGKYDAKIQAQMEAVEPVMDRETVKEKVQLMASFTTKTTNNADRNENIRIASELINGLVIKPGEEFSMNEVTGPRGSAEGYKPAGTIVNGKLVEEPGGGVCQVSTTLYNALVDAGLRTTERYSHSLEPSYVNPGEDAMISYPGNDLKFVNNASSSVMIRFRFSDSQLTASVYGIPVLEEGVTVEMYSEKAGIIPMPKPVYEEDPALKYGEEVTVNAGRDGLKVITYLITKKDGAEVSREFFHNSSYNPKTPLIRRNSKAKPGESPSPSPSPSPEESLLPGTEQPTASKEPEAGRTPAPTKAPEAGRTPAPTKAPEAGRTPAPTKPTAETAAPEATQEPLDGSGSNQGEPADDPAWDQNMQDEAEE